MRISTNLQFTQSLNALLARQAESFKTQLQLSTGQKINTAAQDPVGAGSIVQLDRARAERRTEGWARILTDTRGRILGATLVGPHAGELIGLWALALQARLRIGAIAGMVLPYPTLGEISKRAAGQFYTPTLFGAGTRRLVGWIQRWLP